MPKVKKEPPYIRGQAERWYFYCPGCLAFRKAQGDDDEQVMDRALHCVSVAKHKFNGDADSPTFEPSILFNFTPGYVCHSFVRDGRIEYLGDCTHELAGQTLELPEITADPYFELCAVRLDNG